MVDSVLIVGASVAGVGAANELRRSGFTGEITLVDGQPHLPYDRPPLSKAALHDADLNVHFHDADYYADQRIALRLGSSARTLDAAGRSVEFRNGERLAADAIILATGARARVLPGGRSDGVHTIRDLDDTLALRTEFRPGRRLAVIGGGFIGAEVAAIGAKLGMATTWIVGADLPFQHVLGCDVAARIARLHLDANIAFIPGVSVNDVIVDRDERRVALDDGKEVIADVVVAGIGSCPNIEWLKGSGIAICDGVVCDALGRTSAAHIYAAGDVAAWPNAHNGIVKRQEHWTAAREQARIVAQQIAGVPGTAWAEFVPYFWSDMHGKRIQLLGTAEGASTVALVFENPDTGAFVAEYRRSERLIGVAGCNAAARVMRYAGDLAPSRRATHDE